MITSSELKKIKFFHFTIDNMSKLVYYTYIDKKIRRNPK